MRIRIRDRNNMPQAIAAISRMNNKKAKVGYLTEGDMKMIAAVHEYGVNIQVTDKMRGYLAYQGLHLKKTTTHITIPERSFIRTGTDLNQNVVTDKARELIVDVLEGNVPVELFFKMLGEELKGKIQEHAIDLNGPVNHPFTVEMKGSNNPLVQSGGLIGAMEVEVE